jgi:uncharacterized membrane protein
VVFAFNNNERRDRPALGIDALNYCSPFLIARLGQFRLAFPIRAYNNHLCGNLTHHKAGFVKIVDIGISDLVFRDCVAHKVKSGLN